MVVAHRSCWADGAPENSASAIRKCIALHADMIEIDVALAAHGVPVLMHDPSVVRMTNGTGLVSALTFAELRSLDLRAGSRFGLPQIKEWSISPKITLIASDTGKSAIWPF
jgi:glycerophosphoryl diester phosphodiesterase